MLRRGGLGTRLAPRGRDAHRSHGAAARAWGLRDRQKTRPENVPTPSAEGRTCHVCHPEPVTAQGAGGRRQRRALAPTRTPRAAPGPGSHVAPRAALAQHAGGRRSGIISGQGESPAAQNSRPPQLPQALKLYRWRFIPLHTSPGPGWGDRAMPSCERAEASRRPVGRPGRGGGEGRARQRDTRTDVLLFQLPPQGASLAATSQTRGLSHLPVNLNHACQQFESFIP